MTQLRPHQERALAKLSNGKILWGGVGSGKTLVAAEYYKLHEAPRDVYVITTAKKRDSFDWQEEFYKLGIGPITGPSGPAPTNRKKARSGSTGSDGLLPEGGSESRSVGGGDSSLEVCGDEQAEREWLEGPDVRGDLASSRPGGDLAREGDAVSWVGRAGQYPYVLTVDSWQNIAKYADVAGAFFIFDEQRLVGSGDWTRKFLRIAKRNRWILLSATPGDTWMDYVPIFVANDFYKNRTEFKREHVVYNTFTKFPKVDRYINVGRLIRNRAKVLVEMPYERHTNRNYVEVPLPYDKEKLELVLKKRWHVFEDRPLREVSEMFSVARRIVNGDPSRLEMVKELWKNHPKLIVFYNFNYELESLRSLRGYSGISTSSTGSSMSSTSAGSGTMTPRPTSFGGTSSAKTSSKPTLDVSGETLIVLRERSLTTAGVTDFGEQPTTSPVHIAEWNGHKHEAIPKADRWLYLVQYTAGAEGWNCIETDAEIMYSKNYSWKTTEQAYGRIDRLNTPFKDLWYYRFTTDSWIDQAIERSLKAKETFNEAKYVRMFGG